MGMLEEQVARLVKEEIANLFQSFSDDILRKIHSETIKSLPSLTLKVDDNSTLEWNKSDSNKDKVLTILRMKKYITRKRDIVSDFMKFEGLDEPSKSMVTDQVTNALSMLRTDGMVVPVKANMLDKRFSMKGGMWGLSHWVKDGKPLVQYVPPHLINE